MNALDYANVRKNVIIHWDIRQSPIRGSVAWIPPETSLPFDLSRIEGKEESDGSFTANLTDGPKIYDWRGREIVRIRMWEDDEKWSDHYREIVRLQMWKDDEKQQNRLIDDLTQG